MSSQIHKETVIYYKIAGLVVLLFLLASCGVSRKAAESNKVSTLQNDVVAYGKKYLGKPYRYAGKGPNSFDCSGFTSFVFKKFGYNLSASSSEQSRQLPAVRRKEELRKGDLVFFEGRRHDGKVGHVGIVTETRPSGEFSFIHASTGNGVIVSSSTEPYYALRYLRGAKVLPNSPELAITQKSDNKATRVKEDKRKNAFTPAKAKENPKNEPNAIDMTELQPIGGAYQTAAAANKTDSTEIIIHSRAAELLNDTVKIEQAETVPVKTSDADSTQNKTQIDEKVKQAMITREELLVPKPAEVKNDSIQTKKNTQPLIHIVQPGETLYAISRKYNCSVQQLKEWNQQLGNVLKSGEKLSVYKK